MRAVKRANRYGSSFTDPFTEANNGLLRLPWEMVRGEPGLKVVGNKAVPVAAAGTESRMCRRIPEGTATWSVTVTYGTLTGGAHQGISFIDAAPGEAADRGAIFIDASASGIAVYEHPITGGFNNKYFSPAVPGTGSVAIYQLTRSNDTYTLRSNGVTLATWTTTSAVVPRVGRALHLWDSTGNGSFDDVTVNTGYANAVLADGPALYWRLDDSSGTAAADSSGHSRPGTYIGSPTLGVAGLVTGDPDTCVTFNGSSQYVTRAYEAWMNSSAITLEALVKTTSSGTNKSIIDRDDTNGRIFQFRKNTANHLEFIMLNGPIFVSGAALINDGLKHHVAATVATVAGTTTIKTFVDGLLDGSFVTSAYALNVSSLVDLRVGVNASSGPNAYWAGQIDEVAMWTSALTDAQIATRAKLAR